MVADLRVLKNRRQAVFNAWLKIPGRPSTAHCVDGRQVDLLMELTRDVSLTRDKRNATAWLLAASILLHPLLTYLATPLVSAHGSGQWIVVCTLQGEQAHFLEFDDSKLNGPESCPALMLLQVVGTGSMAVPPFVPGRQLYTSASVDTAVDYPYLAPHFAFFPSRAPPLT